MGWFLFCAGSWAFEGCWCWGGRGLFFVCVFEPVEGWGREGSGGIARLLILQLQMYLACGFCQSRVRGGDKTSEVTGVWRRPFPCDPMSPVYMYIWDSRCHSSLTPTFESAPRGTFNKLTIAPLALHSFHFSPPQRTASSFIPGPFRRRVGSIPTSCTRVPAFLVIDRRIDECIIDGREARR